MNQAELEAKLEKYRKWYVGVQDNKNATGHWHPKRDEQFDIYYKYWSEWWDIKTKARLF
jgi:hypothetical protein